LFIFFLVEETIDQEKQPCPSGKNQRSKRFPWDNFAQYEDF